MRITYPGFFFWGEISYVNCFFSGFDMARFAAISLEQLCWALSEG